MTTPQAPTEKSMEKKDEAGPSNGAKQEGAVKKKLPQLGALEDDDEFEVCSQSTRSYAS